MKKLTAILMVLCLMLPVWAMATSSGWYVVESTSPYGYAYLYSAASDRNHLSRNLGRYDNGSWVYVVNYYGGRDGKYNYCYVQTADGRYGYMHDYALRSAEEDGVGWFRVESTSPYGYAYLYSAASDRDHLSTNQGRYDNGELVYVVEYYGGQDGKYNYCYVRTQDGKVGYMHDYALVSVDGYVPNDGYTNGGSSYNGGSNYNNGSSYNNGTSYNNGSSNYTGGNPVGKTIMITTSSGNARSGPGSNYSQVAYVNYGETYKVLDTERASNGVTWFKIQVYGRYCWISSGLTNVGKY